MPADPYEAARQAQRGAVARRRRRLRRSHPASVPADASANATAGEPPAGSPTQRQGRAAEARAAHHLETHGAHILAANLRCRAGEIDLVAREGALLLFIEVRERRNPAFGGAAASVNRPKQARLIRAARHFLPRLVQRHFGGTAPACRFDVVAFEADGPHWIRDAFQA
ncbi:MAG: YraN family protein [Castellaniella sp.]|uniref:YraN family protein n=2 Tax=Castellaniella sp. TaxID=1955812 RepID=UPI003C74C7A2